MNSEQRSQIAKQLEGTSLKGAEVRGKTLLRRCCGERMIKLGLNNGKREIIVYCQKGYHSYNPSLANFLDPAYAFSGFS